MLTQKDIELLKKVFATKDDLEQIKNEFKFIPNKEEFFSKMDELMIELKASREENEISNHRQSEHTDQLEDHEVRITKLESSTATI